MNSDQLWSVTNYSESTRIISSDFEVKYDPGVFCWDWPHTLSLLLFLQRRARHQQQVTGHELHVEDAASAARVLSDQLAAGAVAGGAAVGAAYVPHPHRVVHGGGGHQTAVLTEGEAGDAVAVTPQVLEQAAGRQVPQLQSLVLSGRGQVLAVGWEGERQHGTTVPGEQPHRRPLLRAPQPHGFIRGAGGHVVGVGVEFDAVDVGEVSGVQTQRIGAREAPEARGAVVGRRGEVEAAGTDVHVPDGVGVATVQDGVREAVQIPEAHGGVLRTGQQAGAVRQERRAVHGAAVSAQGLYLTARGVLVICLITNTDTAQKLKMDGNTLNHLKMSMI